MPLYCFRNTESLIVSLKLLKKNPALKLKNGFELCTAQFSPHLIANRKYVALSLPQATYAYMKAAYLSMLTPDDCLTFGETALTLFR